MRISLNWLADYVDLPGSAEGLAAQMTHCGMEVEGLEKLGAGLEGVVVAQILESAPHPKADKLSVTRVDAGSAGTLTVVCGAKNYKVGDKVPLATVGTRLPSGPVIEKAVLRGVESLGMLCSARELGLSDDASGLLILDPALRVGQPIADALGLHDVVFEVNVTPNRPDWLSHLGLAREVAALTGQPLRLPPCAVDESEELASAQIQVAIEDPEGCPRYAARVLSGVRVGPSPWWMQNRLRAVGVRSLSNAVDVTNYVLYECGQPLHAFDLDQVRGGRIVVRRARPGERLTTLDGKERALSADDLCICDAEAPSALAGVMGGADSEVSHATTRILLESARFAPALIRRTARRHGLQSDSSYRFERGVDPAMVEFAQDRAARLLAELCGARVLKGRVDVHPRPPARRRFALRLGRVNALLGTEVPEEKSRRILSDLGFRLEGEGSVVQVEVPSWRLDVEGEADCAEEIARLHGYDAIPSVMPRGAAELAPEPASRVAERRMRLALAAAGFDEVINYSFVSERELQALTPGIRPIALRNPLASEQAVMCTTRLAGLLANLRRSRNRQVEDVRLYELGRVYLPAADADAGQPADEPRVIAGVLAGFRAPLQWGQAREPVDFYDLKGAVEGLLEALAIREARFSPISSELLHPRSACEVRVGETRLGILGELHPTVCEALDVPRGVLVFELLADKLVAAANLVPRFTGLPRFPAVLRDIAVVLDAQIPAGQVEAEIRAAAPDRVEEVVLFDVYRGEGIAPGSKSLAFAVRLRAADHTLNDEEANRAHAQIVQRLQERFGAKLRA